MAHFSTHIITLPGGGQISPTPDLAGETTAFPIYLIKKVIQDEHDTVLAKKSLESNPKQKNLTALKNSKAIKDK